MTTTPKISLSTNNNGLEPTLPKNYIAIDTNKKQLIINLDSPNNITEFGSGEIWSIVLRAPNTNVEMDLQSLTIKTKGDLCLQTDDDSYLLLNTSREQYKKGLEENNKIVKELEETGKCPINQLPE